MVTPDESEQPQEVAVEQPEDTEVPTADADVESAQPPSVSDETKPQNDEA